MLDDVKFTMEKLHEAGLIHGNIRRFDIMVVKSWGSGKESGVDYWWTSTGRDLSAK